VGRQLMMVSGRTIPSVELSLPSPGYVDDEPNPHKGKLKNFDTYLVCTSDFDTKLPIT
jgi:hypothetical protein